MADLVVFPFDDRWVLYWLQFELVIVETERLAKVVLKCNFLCRLVLEDNEGVDRRYYRFIVLILIGIYLLLDCL